MEIEVNEIEGGYTGECPICGEGAIDFEVKDKDMIITSCYKHAYEVARICIVEVKELRTLEAVCYLPKFD